VDDAVFANEVPEQGGPAMPELLDRVRRLEHLQRIVYELGGGRALDNTRREIEATKVAIARVDALARRVPPTSGESSPDGRSPELARSA
jgi:hypothetical protein